MSRRRCRLRLTKAQARSIREMGDDLAQRHADESAAAGRRRLGQDGVAFAAALQVARAKRQTAVMAPTELLAEQHAETWQRWAEATGLRIELLTASTPKARARVAARAARGRPGRRPDRHALAARRGRRVCARSGSS